MDASGVGVLVFVGIGMYGDGDRYLSGILSRAKCASVSIS